jgi:hypothetical protein
METDCILIFERRITSDERRNTIAASGRNAQSKSPPIYPAKINLLVQQLPFFFFKSESEACS